MNEVFNLRWQAQRDTAFARAKILRIKSRPRLCESAVAAPALPTHSKIAPNLSHRHPFFPHFRLRLAPA